MSRNIEEIVEALKKCYYGELCEHNFYEDVVFEFKNNYKKTFSYDQGASKGVLIFEELNIVIKIPFCGNYYEGDEYYDENLDVYYGNDFEYFYGADTSDSWNYCEVEKERYKMAKQDGINKCFAGVGLLTKIEGHPIYIQEFADMYDYKSTGHTKEDTESVKEMCKSNSYNCFNEEWLSDVFNYFGKDIFNRFMMFIDDIGINDLHNGNIGYIKGRPVLVDYSGWGD